MQRNIITHPCIKNKNRQNESSLHSHVLNPQLLFNFEVKRGSNFLFKTINTFLRPSQSYIIQYILTPSISHFKKYPFPLSENFILFRFIKAWLLLIVNGVFGEKLGKTINHWNSTRPVRWGLPSRLENFSIEMRWFSTWLHLLSYIINSTDSSLIARKNILAFMKPSLAPQSPSPCPNVCLRSSRLNLLLTPRYSARSIIR